MVFVCLFQINAIPTIFLENVCLATLATISSEESVFWHLFKAPPILDAQLGTGKAKNVLYAPKTLFSITTESARPFQVNAIPSICLANVCHALSVTTSLEDNAFLRLFRVLLTPDVDCGTGMAKNASNARTIGFSILTESAPQFRTNVRRLTFLEDAYRATMVTTSLEDNVFLPLFRVLLILDAELGIGLTRNVRLAQRTGFSTITAYAFKFLINARHLLYQVFVIPAMSAITWWVENACWLQSRTWLILDAVFGTGLIRFVSNVLTDGCLTVKGNACQ